MANKEKGGLSAEQIKELKNLKDNLLSTLLPMISELPSTVKSRSFESFVMRQPTLASTSCSGCAGCAGCSACLVDGPVPDFEFFALTGITGISGSIRY